MKLETTFIDNEENRLYCIMVDLIQFIKELNKKNSEHHCILHTPYPLLSFSLSLRREKLFREMCL